jgi:anti-anti-sigma regulatory factor
VLCERVRTLVAGGDRRIVCDVAALTDPDVRTVDALARLQLTAKRLGGSIRLRGTSTRLEELLALIGLGEVMPLCVEAVGQTEEREETLGVEEEADARDLAAVDREDL